MIFDATFVLSVFVKALAAFFVIELIRALPLPAEWLSAKPISCNVCMAGWFGLSVAAPVGWESVMLLSERVAFIISAACIAGLTLVFLDKRSQFKMRQTEFELDFEHGALVKPPEDPPGPPAHGH